MSGWVHQFNGCSHLNVHRNTQNNVWPNIWAPRPSQSDIQTYPSRSDNARELFPWWLCVIPHPIHQSEWGRSSSVCVNQHLEPCLCNLKGCVRHRAGPRTNSAAGFPYLECPVRGLTCSQGSPDSTSLPSQVWVSKHLPCGLSQSSEPHIGTLPHLTPL